MSSGGGEGGPSLAGLDLVFGILIDILAEVNEHQDGDGGAEALLHGFENFSCFHDCCLLRG